MNRRAIVLHFIITVLLALIIFIPACLFVSKFFRLSEQAETNFNEFVQKLEDFKKSEKQKDSFLLIMDKETFIASFLYPTTVEFKIETRETGGGTFRSSEEKMVTVAHYFSYPSQCLSVPCICLCQEAQEGEAVSNLEKRSISYSCNQLRCTVLQDFPLADNWGISRLTEEEPRRIAVEMRKENGQVILTAKK
ncbi:MAG: hypothetical protein AABX13_05480 [Nanoarchaeota archaeon]